MSFLILATRFKVEDPSSNILCMEAVENGGNYSLQLAPQSEDDAQIWQLVNPHQDQGDGSILILNKKYGLFLSRKTTSDGLTLTPDGDLDLRKWNLIPSVSQPRGDAKNGFVQRNCVFNKSFLGVNKIVDGELVQFGSTTQVSLFTWFTCFTIEVPDVQTNANILRIKIKNGKYKPGDKFQIVRTTVDGKIDLAPKGAVIYFTESNGVQSPNVVIPISIEMNGRPALSYIIPYDKINGSDREVLVTILDKDKALFPNRTLIELTQDTFQYTVQFLTEDPEEDEPIIIIDPPTLP